MATRWRAEILPEVWLIAVQELLQSRGVISVMVGMSARKTDVLFSRQHSRTPCLGRVHVVMQSLRDGRKMLTSTLTRGAFI
jgi:hypothetical protein